MFSFDSLPVPLIAAPLAGGASTPELVAAVGAAGGLGFLAAGYRTAAAVRKEIDAVRALGEATFGVNVFVPDGDGSAAGRARAVSDYRKHLASEAARYGIELPHPVSGATDDWNAKLELLSRAAPAVVSFTFGLPERSIVRELQRAGSMVLATVTDEPEARAAVVGGVDGLCVQGPEAGGHRGTHAETKVPDSRPLRVLLAAVRSMTDLPLVAAGGLATPVQVAAVLRQGAAAVQLGTAFLRTPESGAAPAYKDALAASEFRQTVVTRAFSGRLARGLTNRFITEHEDEVPSAYPEVHELTAPIRRAAARAGDPHAMSLWAGTGFRRAAAEPAAAVVARLTAGV